MSLSLPRETIGSFTFAAKPNPNADRTGLEHVIEYSKTASGSYRELKLLEQLSKLASIAFKEMDESLSSYFKSLSGKLGAAVGMLGIPRLPDVTKKAWTAITDWSCEEGSSLSGSRIALEKTHDVFDAGATWAYTGSLLGKSAWKNAGDTFNLVAEVADVATASDDWRFSMEHLSHSKSEPVKQAFRDTARVAFSRLVKSVASVVSGVIGLLALVLGGPILSPLSMLGIGLISTIAAFTSHFFKETRQYKDMIDQRRQPQLLVMYW